MDFAAAVLLEVEDGVSFGVERLVGPLRADLAVDGGESRSAERSRAADFEEVEGAEVPGGEGCVCVCGGGRGALGFCERFAQDRERARPLRQTVVKKIFKP